MGIRRITGDMAIMIHAGDLIPMALPGAIWDGHVMYHIIIAFIRAR